MRAMRRRAMPRSGKGILALLVLGVVATVALVIWAQGQPKAEETSGLPCPPAVVRIEPLTRDVPRAAVTAVTQAIEASGRKAEVVRDGGDLKVNYWAGRGKNRLSSTTLLLGSIPTKAEAQDLLRPVLTLCTKPTTEPTEKPAEADKPSNKPAPRWPWEASSPVTWLAIALATWFVIVPVVMYVRRPTPDHLRSDRQQDRHEKKEALQ